MKDIEKINLMKIYYENKNCWNNIKIQNIISSSIKKPLWKSVMPKYKFKPFFKLSSVLNNFSNDNNNDINNNNDIKNKQQIKGNNMLLLNNEKNNKRNFNINSDLNRLNEEPEDQEKISSIEEEKCEADFYNDVILHNICGSKQVFDCLGRNKNEDINDFFENEENNQEDDDISDDEDKK